jgi:FtsP/CotA-like multicopper oxidase with cupredoxin domain
MFDPSRIDVRVRLGAVEQWTIRTETDELHSFHMHQALFQVTDVNGTAQWSDGLRDMIVGRFPFHCHVLSHEDRV